MSQSLDVRRFMEACDQPTRIQVTMPTEAERLLRVRLVVEEAYEFAAAMGVRVISIADDLHELNQHSVQVEIIEDAGVDIVEAADALADSLYVVHGSGWTLGIPLDDVFDEVHASNMQKINPATGKPDVSPDGKVLKPEGWQPPDVRQVLLDDGWDGGTE